MAKSRTSSRNPRILMVTPEITYLPAGMGNMANMLNAKAGGLADVSASLVSALFELGADVHVALPHYRRMFHVDVGRFINDELRVYKRVLPEDRIHLAQDRIFYYRDEVYSNHERDARRLALAFQREVINNIIPRVNPDLIHCNDWMTGLVPAMARRLGIPSLFTIHNIHSQNLTLAEIEDSGIDAAEFWSELYFKNPPFNYESTRNANQVDMLVSGIFSSHFVNTVSPEFLNEICQGRHEFVDESTRTELVQKFTAQCASGILNAPDPSYNPRTDELIECKYNAEDHVAGKRANKMVFQERLGLTVDADVPLLFWPSRLDPVQKGCQLVADILYAIVSDYWDKGLQVAVVANGPFQNVFRNIVRHHEFYDRVAIVEFDEGLSRLGYAASDFMLMPSRFEPCGLPQMVSAIYGNIPIVHDTGGLHDTIEHIDTEAGTGNGIVFEHYDPGGLRWGIDQAMDFYARPAEERNATITRIMNESIERFTHSVTAAEYIKVYEKMLHRPLVKTH